MTTQPLRPILGKEWLVRHPVKGALFHGTIVGVVIAILTLAQGGHDRPWLLLPLEIVFGVLFFGIPSIVWIRRGASPRPPRPPRPSRPPSGREWWQRLKGMRDD